VRFMSPEAEERYDALVAVASYAVVGLDFDGTLAPIVPDPEQARAHPDAVPALAALAPRIASVAVVTGRPAGVAVRHGGFAGVPGLEHLVVLGHYGAERWDAATGMVTSEPVPPGVTTARDRLPGLLREAGVPDAFVEDKDSSLAVHTRRLDDPVGAFELLRAPLTALAEETSLRLEPGNLVLELRPPGIDKGVALRGLIESTGARSILYAGDDLGDLAAYRAIQAERETGLRAVLLATRSSNAAELIEAADVVVDDPSGVVTVLTALSDAISAR